MIEGYIVKLGKFYLNGIKGNESEGFTLETHQTGTLFDEIHIRTVLDTLKKIGVNYRIFEVEQGKEIYISEKRFQRMYEN